MYIYMEENNGKESNNIDKIEKQSNQKAWIYNEGKSPWIRFGFNKPSSGL